MKKLYLITLLFMLSTTAFSQGKITFANSEILFRTDSIKIGEEVDGEYYIRNIGDSTLYGLLMKTTLRTHKGSFLAYDSVYIDSLTTNPWDTPRITFRFTPTLQYFDPGNNIIVVWPTGTTVNGDTIQADSSSKQSIPAGSQVSIFVKSNPAGLYFFPNPAADKLYIKATPLTTLTYIKVYSLTGKEQLSTDGQTGELDLSGMAPGVLLIEAGFKNGEREFFKVLKTY